ncbi:Nramp family divalent metal transporter [Apibacter sp.]|uniref:Nramp family divalent metal transporter n=1 Tax=Apibacter sp. TaxID=2023709 RepID=UPI0026005EE3|nr:Nramp family divalent metal transporter [Apibacter sp.]MCT6868359.1 Nramp family divalent metal transporter [Apibacter sp.]
MSKKSLQEVHATISTENPKKWKKILSFFGPAYLVAVGYLDPGNWATDIAGGSKFGYALIWVLLMSNIMALLLQALSARLGIVRGLDLAQTNREYYPKWMNYILYSFAEIAIAATDLAEVLGMAIGLQLLFGLDLIWGVWLAALDTLILLVLQRFGMRKMEAFIISLVAIIGGCFLMEMFLAKPDLIEVSKGFKPTLPNTEALYIAIGIIGATVMPHNLYLHSALVQTRKIKRDHASIKRAIKYNFYDSLIALNMAFFVNAAILVLAASTFYKAGLHDVSGLHDAYKMLSDLLGPLSPFLFAVALIAAGQSSTVTGTLAGQIVMEGYLHFRMNPALRRLLTRMLAIIPAVVVISILGENSVDEMLIFSQVLLSMQLGFAIIPLIHFVSDKEKMGTFAIKLPVKIISWIICIIIIILNIKLIYDEEINVYANENVSLAVKILLGTVSLSLLLFLISIVLYPWIKKTKKLNFNIHHLPPQKSIKQIHSFKVIGIALDFSTGDQRVLDYLPIFAGTNSLILLFHVTESASANYNGKMADDFEVKFDQNKLDEYKNFLIKEGYTNVETKLGFGNPAVSLPQLITENKIDVLLMAKHEYKGIADFTFGVMTNRLSNKTNVPILVV